MSNTNLTRPDIEALAAKFYEAASSGVRQSLLMDGQDGEFSRAIHRNAPALFALALDGLRVREAETLLEDFAEYKGEGPATTPWRDIVRDIGEKSRAFLREGRKG